MRFPICHFRHLDGVRLLVVFVQYYLHSLRFFEFDVAKIGNNPESSKELRNYFHFGHTEITENTEIEVAQRTTSLSDGISIDAEWYAPLFMHILIMTCR